MYNHTLTTLGTPISIQDADAIQDAYRERVDFSDGFAVGNYSGQKSETNPCSGMVGEELSAELEMYFGDGGYACWRNEDGYLYIVATSDGGLYGVTVTD